MKNNKSPGLDGLPVEFYKTFFRFLGPIVFEAIKYCLEQEILTRSMRRGLLVLIPKKGRDPRLIKNWRPLTLMNVDHKVIAKMLANRLKPVLKDLIAKHQSGYMEGRFIGNNIRTMIDVIQHCDFEDIPAIMVSIDFEKCFDTIEFTAIEVTILSY